MSFKGHFWKGLIQIKCYLHKLNTNKGQLILEDNFLKYFVLQKLSYSKSN